jgi:hypothetical protein
LLTRNETAELSIDSRFGIKRSRDEEDFEGFTVASALKQRLLGLLGELLGIATCRECFPDVNGLRGLLSLDWRVETDIAAFCPSPFINRGDECKDG